MTFPGGKVQTHKQVRDTPVGKLELTNVSVAKTPNEIYALMYGDFPPNLPLQLDSVAETVKAQWMTVRPGAKVTKEKKVKVDGVDALEVFLETPNAPDIRDVFILSGSRLYQIMVTAPKDVVGNDEADAFVNSFKFVK